MTDWYGWMFVLRRPYIPAANSSSGLLAAHTAVPSDAWTASSDPWPKAIGAPTRPTDRPKCRPLAAECDFIQINKYYRSEEKTPELPITNEKLVSSPLLEK